MLERLSRLGSPRARTPRIALLACLVGLPTCQGGITDVVARVEVTPEAALVVGIGSTLRLRVVTVDRVGVPSYGADAVWAVTDPTVATVDASGIVTAISRGVTEVSATVGDVIGHGTVEVYVPPEIDEYRPGERYLGRNGYVEYVPGRLPVILSVPHGGDLRPLEIPDRTAGVLGGDAKTIELTMAVRTALVELTGHAPHVVVLHLDRIKLDANREIEEAAQQNGYAARAFEEYHGFIEIARAAVLQPLGGGMYFDMHGHGHEIERLELGYLLGAELLNRPDRTLNSLETVRLSSIREIGRTRPEQFAEILRGPTSLGGLLEARGVPVLPSPADPYPLDDPYFTGGYSTRRHGSQADSELVSGIQIEHHYRGIRDSDSSRRAYAESLAAAIRAFMLEYFGGFEPTPQGP